MKSNQRKIGAILSYVSIFASSLIQLLYTPFLVEKLGQSEYGLYSLVSSIIGYLTVLDLGFGNAVVVHTAKYRATGEREKEQKLHGMFHLIYIAIGILAGLAGVALAFNSNSIFSAAMTPDELQKMRIMLLILSFNLFATFAFSIYSSIIAANEKFIFQKTLSIVNTIAKPLLMIPVLFMGYKSIALCLVITFINIIVLFANYLFCKRKLKILIKFSGFDKTIMKVILGYSIWIFLNQIVNKANWSVDQFILGAVSGTAAVSVYSAASTLNVLFINLSTAISSVMLPKISKMVAKKATSEELTSELIKVGRIQYYIIFLMASGLVIFGRQFINLWLGHDFDDAYWIALILIIPVCFPLIQNLGLSIMQAMNKYKFKAISTFLMSIANMGVSVVLAQRYGAIGAAIGTAGALIICNILIINIYYAKIIKLNVLKFWAQIAKMSVIFLIPAIIGYFIVTNVGIDSWLKLLIGAASYSVVYGIIAYCICANKYEKGIASKVFRKVKRSTK